MNVSSISTRVLVYFFSSYSDYTEHHTDTSFRFVVTMTKASMNTCEETGFHETFKLKKSLATNNLVSFRWDWERSK